jgi:hypothetical protein
LTTSSPLSGRGVPALRSDPQPLGTEHSATTTASTSRDAAAALPLALAGAAAAIGAIALGAASHRAAFSPVLGDVVDGVQLLANPATPDTVKGIVWGVPKNGSMWGIAPRVSVEHVDQGFLGDCWDVAGMGGIAVARPDEIDGKIVQEFANHVVVRVDGKHVAISKELPLINGTPAFAGAEDVDRVYWPAYIEKAQAALLPDGYNGLKGGRSTTTFEQLLGSDAKLQPGTPGGPFADGATAFADRVPVALGSVPETGRSPELTKLMTDLNVHGNHAYVVVKRGLTDAGEPTIRLFNPWGHKHPVRDLTASEVNQMFRVSYTPDALRAYPKPTTAAA